MPPNISENIRKEVAERAKFSCEYCLFPDGYSHLRHQIDHIISVQHGGDTVLDNLAYACIYCNWAKGPNLSSLDHRRSLSRLFNPRTDVWSDHFRLNGAAIEPVTEIGQATVSLLKMNQADRLERRAALQQLDAFSRQ